MATDNLRDELLAVPGIADAEIDAEPGTASEVRVHLQPDADASRVGTEVQRILASLGMRSRVATEQLAPVVDLPVGPDPSPPPPPEPTGPMQGAQPPAPGSAPPGEPVPAVGFIESPPGGHPALASLVYEESADGVVVTAVASDGRRFSRRAADTTDPAVSAAVAAAVGALTDGRPQRLLWTSSASVEGSEVVTVVLEKIDGTRVAGAAIVRAAKPFAVARATFVALRG